MTRKILVVDDEESILTLLTHTLTRAGFGVYTASDGLAALETARRERPDAVILDLMLPDLDGFEVFRRLQREHPVPVIFLTAKGEEVDRIVGLELGADDYVTKPFSPRELVARVKVVLRRNQAETETAESASARRRTFGRVTIDLDRHQVFAGDEPVELTPKEFELLSYLAGHPGRALSRELILERVWGGDYFGDTRTVDVHIRHLREKLEADPAEPKLIQTVRGIGYRLRETADD